ncbi:MAG: hypothetical protein IKW99_09700 [Bacteroidales bacterium]|nr:hypothetical protein [Bacteroidales bacterium]
MRETRFIYIIARAVTILAVSFAFTFCDKDPDLKIDPADEGINYTPHGGREPMEETRRVLLFYECGFNSLNYDLSRNMEEELPEGLIPGGGRHDNVLLVFSKFAINANYKDVPSYLRRLYKDSEGNIVSDTLKTYSASTIASSSATMREVLSLVKSMFPAKGYALEYSSHGSGWLPPGYYNNPSSFESSHRSDGRKMTNRSTAFEIPTDIMERDDPYAGMVRSIGQDKMSSGDVEMTVSEFVDGIPFHLDFLLFDMCFSGGIEVAYALKDKADYLGISTAEVLAAGMYDYTKIIDFLLKGPNPDLLGLYKDSFDRYDKQSGLYRSATVTLLRTDRLDNLAAVCKDLISAYPDNLAHAPASQIQGYFRSNRHYFYDLEDIFAKSGVSEGDLARLSDAISDCMVYRAATPSFLGSFDIKTFSGLSMYLPVAGTPLLDSYYKNEPWNKAVGLVK